MQGKAQQLQLKTIYSQFKKQNKKNYKKYNYDQF